MQYEHIKLPPGGERISINPDGSLNVPDRAIIPFIEGDGIGVDVTPVMKAVVDAAVAKSYGGRRAIEWLQVYAGDQAVARYGEHEVLPDETMHALEHYVVSIKG